MLLLLLLMLLLLLRNFLFFIIIFSSNHTTFELWGFFCPTKKMATSWEQVVTMRKESVTLQIEVAATIGVRARGVARTAIVGPATTITVADHHPPYVATTSRRVIKREHPIFTPVYVHLFVFV
jgi:hypothetical protein